MLSLKLRGYMKEQFTWRHFCWYLTNRSIQYLCDYLHRPLEIMPANLYAAAILRLAGRGPKGLGESDPQDSHEEKPAETPTDSTVPPVVPAEAGLTEFNLEGGFGVGIIKPSIKLKEIVLG